MISLAQQPLSVLLIEDDEDLAVCMRTFLERTGRYRIRRLDRGEGVVEEALEFRPDIVLLDFVLPDLDGGEVFQQLKSHPDLNHIPVVIITSLASADTPLDQGVGPGRVTLSKPVHFGKLELAIRLLTQSRLSAHQDEAVSGGEVHTKSCEKAHVAPPA